jgi:lipopolysaccharide export system permease protein
LQISEGTYVYLESFDISKNIGYRFTLEKINSNGLSYKLAAEQINWDSVKTSWHLINYTKRTFFGLKETYSRGKQIDTILNLKPKDFSKRLDNLETMNYMQIRQFIKEEKLKGSDNVPFYEVEKHKRIAFPFATVVLTLIGVSLSSRKLRGGIGMHLGVGITISFAFILFMQISTTFSTYSNLPSFIGVWIPNVIFTVLGLYLLKTAPK